MMETATARSKLPARVPRRLATLGLVLVGALGRGVLLLAMSLSLVFRVARVEGQAMAPTSARYIVVRVTFRWWPMADARLF